MEIIIKEIIEINRKKSKIVFESRFGYGIAIWVGEKPEIGKTYYVETTIEEDFIYGKNLIKSSSINYSITMEHEKLILNGRIERIYDDDVIILSIGKSNNIMLEVNSTDLLTLGDFIQIKVKELLIFDTNIWYLYLEKLIIKID